MKMKLAILITLLITLTAFQNRIWNCSSINLTLSTNGKIKYCPGKTTLLIKASLGSEAIQINCDPNIVKQIHLRRRDNNPVLTTELPGLPQTPRDTRRSSTIFLNTRELSRSTPAADPKKENNSENGGLRITQSEPTAISKSQRLAGGIAMRDRLVAIPYKNIIHMTEVAGGEDQRAKLVVYYISNGNEVSTAEITFDNQVTIEKVRDQFINPILLKHKEIGIKRKAFLDNFNKYVQKLKNEYILLHSRYVAVNGKISSFPLFRHNSEIFKDLIQYKDDSLHQLYVNLDQHIKQVDNSVSLISHLNAAGAEYPNLIVINEDNFNILKQGFELIWKNEFVPDKSNLLKQLEHFDKLMHSFVKGSNYSLAHFVYYCVFKHELFLLKGLKEDFLTIRELYVNASNFITYLKGQCYERKCHVDKSDENSVNAIVALDFYVKSELGINTTFESLLGNFTNRIKEIYDLGIFDFIGYFNILF
jgi:hypothetical protein